MSASSIPARIPDTMNRADIGPYLGELRTGFALSQQDVSVRLHIRLRYITAMEAGEFDQLPGKAYARGYLHSYAEFLGLDPDQVVKQCFGESRTQPVPPPAFTPKASARSLALRTPWRVLTILIVAGLFLLVGWAQWQDAGDEEQTVPSTVMPVPETLLASMRTQLMPQAGNYDCLVNESALGCFYTNRTVHLLSVLEHPIWQSPELADKEALQAEIKADEQATDDESPVSEGDETHE